MKVNYRKTHGENISCGLCNHESIETENLETHLFTCEIYKCNSCSKKCKSLPQVKGHISEEHKRNTVILHSKMNRDNSEHEMSHYSNIYSENDKFTNYTYLNLNMNLQQRSFTPT